jgi:two-component system KDP operon response regulator KdpE
MSLAPAAPPLVLIVEDEPPMRRFLRTCLTTAGYRTAEAETAQQALDLAVERPPDVVVLDLGLPDMDGQEVLVRLREWLTAPIIILSVRNQDAQKISALQHGADDYMTKPFSTGELLARIQVALRHVARRQSGSEAPAFQSADLRVDLATRRVYVRDEEIRLTRIEYKLLTTLVQHAGRVVTYPFLLTEVWGPQQAQNTQHLRVFMAGLRRKIELDPAQPRHLLTEQGVGYRLACE